MSDLSHQIAVLASSLSESLSPNTVAASRAVHEILSRVSPGQLLQLSKRIGNSWIRANAKLATGDVSKMLVDPGSRVAVLGLISFHYSGYIRQEAVRLLSVEVGGDELSYLLLRINDWVDDVSVDALDAVSKRLLACYLPHFVNNIPLVIRLLAVKRRDASPIVHQIVELLVQPEHDVLLAQVIKSSAPVIGRQLIRMALNVQGVEAARVVRYALSSPHPPVRLAGARAISQHFKCQELRDAIGALRNDPCMPIRREAILAEVTFSPENSLNLWKRACLDSSGSIRELARFWMKRGGDNGAAAVYRQHLTENGDSLIAVSGLAECGLEDDLLMLRGYLTHPKSKYRRAVVRGVSRIAKEGAVNDLIIALQDSSLSVSRAACDCLEPYSAVLPGEALARIACEAQAEHARVSAVHLLTSLSPWQSLRWLLHAASFGNESISSLSRELVRNWCKAFDNGLSNRLGEPTDDERQSIEKFDWIFSRSGVGRRL